MIGHDFAVTELMFYDSNLRLTITPYNDEHDEYGYDKTVVDVWKSYIDWKNNIEKNDEKTT